MVDAADDAKAPSAALHALVQEFHDAGFVALQDDAFRPPQALVERIYTVVTQRYESLLQQAHKRGLDLTLPENSEVIPGFYVREGGRIDMQISALAFQKRIPATTKGDGGDENETLPLDMKSFLEMATCWQHLVAEIFREDGGESDAAVSDTTAAASNAKAYRLEYVGCVVSRPGDSDQNWHLDGVHRNLKEHEKADRVNVFVPLVDVSEEIGGTEMKRTSHFHDNGTRGAAFKDYAHLESVTHFVQAGTPLIMDYRVWHRGKANRSEATIRPLLYFKYVKSNELHGAAAAKRSSSAAATEDLSEKKKRKRVALIQLA